MGVDAATNAAIGDRAIADYAASQRKGGDDGKNFIVLTGENGAGSAAL